MELAAQLLPLVGGWFWPIAVAFFRVMPACALLPGFGEQALPVRIKLAIGICLSITVAPMIESPELATEAGTILGVIMPETVTGLLLGLALRLFVMALQTAGAIAAQSTSMSQLLGDTGADPMPAIGVILLWGGIAIGFAAGLHVRAAEYVILSYTLVPLGSLPSGGDMAAFGVAQVSRAFSLAFSLAAPFVVVSVLYNLMLGVVNKAMPQLMVAFIGAPLITAAALGLLAVTAPLILQSWWQAIEALLSSPLTVIP